VQNLAPGAAATTRTRRGLRRPPGTLGWLRSTSAVTASGGPALDRPGPTTCSSSPRQESCAITGSADSPAKPGIPLVDIGNRASRPPNGDPRGNSSRAPGQARVRRSRSPCSTSPRTGWVWVLNLARFTGVDPPAAGPVELHDRRRTAATAPVTTRSSCSGPRTTASFAGWRRCSTGRTLADEPRASGRTQTGCAGREELEAVIAAWVAAHTFAEGEFSRAEKATIGWARPQHTSRCARASAAGTAGAVGPPRTVPAGTSPASGRRRTARGWEWTPGAVPGLGEHTTPILAELDRD